MFVTRPHMPPLDSFNHLLKEIWSTKVLTNNGPFVTTLENKLADYLEVPHISLYSNGTLALIAALHALNIEGEVITTPYSFVATSHALWWNNIKPIFVDIDPDTFCLDPGKIEEAITEKTTAILPVHVYGRPCKAAQIQRIAQKHGLKVIYDAAHAFGVKQGGQSVLLEGDLSILSFHATKVYNTIEGGAVVCRTAEMKNKLSQLRNFGFVNEVRVLRPGINAKMNELQAAYGLLQLETIDQQIANRKQKTLLYKSLLKDVAGIRCYEDLENVQYNYGYFPILVESAVYGKERDALYYYLQQKNIFGRRYFYPLISEFEPYNQLPSSSTGNLPIAYDISRKVICLPMYYELEDHLIIEICNLIADFSNKKS